MCDWPRIDLRGGDSFQVELRSGAAWRVPATADSQWKCGLVAEEFAVAIETQTRPYETNRPEVHR
jgi:hypothetical protein